MTLNHKRFADSRDTSGSFTAKPPCCFDQWSSSLCAYYHNRQEIHLLSTPTLAKSGTLARLNRARLIHSWEESKCKNNWLICIVGDGRRNLWSPGLSLPLPVRSEAFKSSWIKIILCSCYQRKLWLLDRSCIEISQTWGWDFLKVTEFEACYCF